jgi:hypothetical protein
VVERIADHHPGNLIGLDARPRRKKATGRLNRCWIDVGAKQVAPDHGGRISDPLIHEKSAGGQQKHPGATRRVGHSARCRTVGRTVRGAERESG